MKYSAYIDGVGNRKCDPKIDAIDFEDENEAKQFVIDEFKDKWELIFQRIKSQSLRTLVKDREETMYQKPKFEIILDRLIILYFAIKIPTIITLLLLENFKGGF